MEVVVNLIVFSKDIFVLVQSCSDRSHDQHSHVLVEILQHQDKKCHDQGMYSTFPIE